MKKIVTLIITCLFLASCGTINPYDVPEDEGAYLKNREEYRGKAKLVYKFNDAVTLEGKRSFGDEIDFYGSYTINKIPSGEMSLGLMIYYYPEGSYNDLSMGERLKFVGQVLNSDSRFYRLRNPYEIWVINPKENISGLVGIKLKALEGKTYQINCKIEDGKAYVWLEDASGKKVSKTVRGIGASYPNYWIWEDLPDPVY